MIGLFAALGKVYTVSCIEYPARPADVEAVADAARALDLAPRSSRWGHLALCIIDATFSINAGYAGTINAVRSYASFAGLPSVLLTGEALKGAVSHREDEQTLTEFLESIEALPDDDVSARKVYDNLQLTSTRGGIRKASAVRQIAEILRRQPQPIETLADVSALLTDAHRLDTVEAELAHVPGHGKEGLRMGYIWMTAGDDYHVKPDRHVLGWLGEVLHRSVSVPEARLLLVEAAEICGVTPWVLDHAIWTLKARKPRRRTRF
jgi:hypothetical protein